MTTTSRLCAFAAGMLACLILGSAGPVRAADICTAVAVRDVPALEDSSSVLKKGDLDTAVTQYRVNKQTGRTTLCSHGGYCYPMRIAVGGDLLEALRLTNCKVASQPSFDDGENLIYDLEPVRSKIPAPALRFDDLDNRFLQLGLCSACASNVAEWYIEQPESRCSKLARAALEGNPDATRQLQEFPDYCTWRGWQSR